MHNPSLLGLQVLPKYTGCSNGKVHITELMVFPAFHAHSA